MLKITLLAVILGVAVAQNCGTPAITPSPGRIVGGTEARAHSWPWQVALLLGSSQICGGSVINNNWIMTAAHCCEGFTASRLNVRVGAHSLRSTSEANARTIAVSRIVMHPSYRSSPVAQNDFCLLRVASPITYSTQVQPICLPTASDGPAGQDCIVTGWGNTAAVGKSFADFVARVEEAETTGKDVQTRASDVLRQVTVKVTTNAVCNSAYGNNYITPQMICAAAPGKDSCQGDSGGPFVCKNSSGKYTLVGVVSWGYGCAHPSYPGVYARTSTALSWISSTAV